MYTEEDLNYAVKNGIFTDISVEKFRAQVSALKNTPSVDEENFRLISSFNDIFVVIACSLLLCSSLVVLWPISYPLALLVYILSTWGLSEVFVRKRKMALPAIILLLSFVGGVFTLSTYILGIYVFSSPSDTPSIATLITVVAAYIHWKRFKVPITVAAGTCAAMFCVIFLVLTAPDFPKEWFSQVLFACGMLTFLFAMYWDASDRTRTTHRSDTAFWLHLLSAPFIIHPIFSNLGILKGNEDLSSMAIVIVLYALMTFISVVIDRRAFMVSSLAYVFYAVISILKMYGVIASSIALTGVLIGSALLLLSILWHPTREKLVPSLPFYIQKYVPKIDSPNNT